MANPEIIHQIQDFRQRVLQADKLRRQGDEEGAKSLEPTKAELIQAIKAYRKSIGERSASRAASASSKAQAAQVLSMDAKNLLD